MFEQLTKKNLDTLQRAGCEYHEEIYLNYQQKSYKNWIFFFHFYQPTNEKSKVVSSFFSTHKFVFKQINHRFITKSNLNIFFQKQLLRPQSKIYIGIIQDEQLLENFYETMHLQINNLPVCIICGINKKFIFRDINIKNFLNKSLKQTNQILINQFLSSSFQFYVILLSFIFIIFKLLTNNLKIMNIVSQNPSKLILTLFQLWQKKDLKFIK